MSMMQRPRQRHYNSRRWVLGALAAVSCAPQVALATANSHVDAQQLILVDETQASRAAAAAAALAHRIDAVAKQIDEQLELDGAPSDVRNEESSLFHSAKQAMRRSALRTLHNRRGMHHLRQGESRHHQQEAHHQLLRRLERKHDQVKVVGGDVMEGALANEVKEAEKLVEDQLERRHAPQRIREQERQLLDGAAKMAEKLSIKDDALVKGSDSGDAKKEAPPNSTAKIVTSSDAGVTADKVSAGNRNSSGSVSVAELRKEHQLLEKRNAELRSENTKLRQQATKEESKLAEQNSDLAKQNEKLEKDNARLQSELGVST